MVEDAVSPLERSAGPNSLPVDELIESIENKEVEGMDDRDRLSSDSDDEGVRLGKKKPASHRAKGRSLNSYLH